MTLRNHTLHLSLLTALACCLFVAARMPAPPSAASIESLTALHAQQTVNDEAREYRIKSAFLYHFLHYGEWTHTVASDEEALTVCVAGDAPRLAALETLSDKQVDQRPVVVRTFVDAAEAGGCRIAFFGAAFGPVAKETLERLRSEGVLTVGETPGFTQGGGMIRLYKHRNRLRFEIKLDAVESAGIHMSSRVLQLATII